MIEVIQDCGRYEDFLCQLSRYISGAGPAPSYLCVSDPQMEDVMSRIAEFVRDAVAARFSQPARV